MVTNYKESSAERLLVFSPFGRGSALLPPLRGLGLDSGLFQGVTPSLFHTSQLRLTLAPGPKLSQAQARSYMRWSPIHTV
jgi:hypothetical protein